MNDQLIVLQVLKQQRAAEMCLHHDHDIKSATQTRFLGAEVSEGKHAGDHSEGERTKRKSNTATSNV